ncbi:oligosaccharide flippase family protein [Pseudothermotoga thermarum]|uniref:Polysaccharide biosynthesis protein n=1 Tax=Pseudothermotoga thermarum DSM 5069 TaxID=688269 RepID=F7YVK3_9THEM|nr:oligosaccharide flippase family protein [Pseudothermotoga thermarum]AEH51658.1 polysaccharide biosynthesis protein [Pseudothermotoga thermarum DSM 5069]
MGFDYKKNFIKSYFAFSAGTWVSFFLSFIQVPTVTRIISPEEFGKSTTFQMLLGFLFPLCLFSTHNAFIRHYYAKDENEKSTLLWTSISLPLALVSVTWIFLIVLEKKVNSFVAGNSQGKVPALLGIALFLSVFQLYNETLLRLENKGKYYSLVQISKSLSNFLIIIVLTFLGLRTYETLILATLGSVFMGLLIGLPFKAKYWLKPKFDSKEFVNIVKYSAPLVFASLSYQALIFTDRFMLRLFTTFEEVGFYSASYKLVSLTTLITAGYSNFWGPYALRLYHENAENNKQIFRKMFNFVAFGMITVSIVFISAKDIVFLLLGSTYRTAAQISPFLLLYPTLIMMAFTVARGIEFAKKTHWFIVSDFSALIANVFGNLALIPLFGAKGAAISTGLSMIIVFAIEGWASNKFYPVGYDFKRAYLSISILVFVAFVNTFFNTFSGVTSGLIGLGLVVLIYKDVFSMLLRDVRKLKKYLLSRLKEMINQ